MNNEQYKAIHEDIWRNRISVPYPDNNVVFSSQNARWDHEPIIKHYDVSCSENVYPVKNFNSMNKKLEAAKKWLKERKEARNG